MAGSYIKPKVYNRHILINTGTTESPVWSEIAAGITSRGNSITENTEKYYYINNRGAAETELTTQEIVRSFSGNRIVGDAAQDKLLIENLYNMDGRVFEFLDYHDNVTGVNGWKGNCTLTISDDGSGDASARETINFSMSLNGKPERGTVTKGPDGTYTFVKGV